MSSAQGFRKANSPWRDPLKMVKNKKCLICGQPAICAVLAALKVGPACEIHGKQAEKLGYEVIFPGDGTLTIKKV